MSRIRHQWSRAHRPARRGWPPNRAMAASTDQRMPGTAGRGASSASSYGVFLGSWWVAEPDPDGSDVYRALVDAFALVIPGRHRAEWPELAETAFDAAALLVTAGVEAPRAAAVAAALAPGGLPVFLDRDDRLGAAATVRPMASGRTEDNGSTRCCHVGYGIPGFPSAGFGIPLHADRPVFRALPNQTVAPAGTKVSRVCVHLSPSVARCPGRGADALLAGSPDAAPVRTAMNWLTPSRTQRWPGCSGPPGRRPGPLA